MICFSSCPPTIDEAIAHLNAARNILKALGAPKTLARVRLAISSAKGARRHAYNAESRRERQEGA